MGLMDLFRRKQPTETRAVASGFTADLITARHEWLSGRSEVAELSATVQACVGLWEAVFTLADVDGTDLLDRASLALLGRSLALRGEAVFLIRDRLIPCIDWDIKTRQGIPRAYRVGIAEAGGGSSQTVLAGEVLHVRIGTSASAPWAGTSPLHRARLSAGLLQEVEGALRDVFRDAPIGSQIVHMPDSSSEDMSELRGAFRGRRGSTLIIEGTAQAVAAGMHPELGRKPDQLSPELERAQAVAMLSAARESVALAYGVLPALLNASTTGPVVREAQRHLAQIILQPLALIVAEEATAKLGTKVTLDVVRPAQAFDAGGKARALSTMLQAMATAKEAGLDPATVKDALQFIDWSEE